MLDEYLTNVFFTGGQLPGSSHLQQIQLFGSAATKAIHSVHLPSVAPSSVIPTPGVHPPIVISPSLPQIPGKLVAKVVQGALVLMRDLLSDNIMQQRQLEI